MSDSGALSPANERPAQIGRYRVLSRLAADAVGEVFHGFDPMIERPVVIRVFHWPGLRPDETQAMTLRFFEQMRRIGGLVHPGVVPLFDAGDCPSGLFMANEFVEGHSLADVLAHSDARDPERAMALLGQLAEVIDYAHAQGVTHQDLKPTNVRLTPDAAVRVGGFGVASVVEAIRGPIERQPSPFRAPECDAGCGADHRADIFAVAALAIALVSESSDPSESSGPAERFDVAVRSLPRALADRGTAAEQWASFVARALAADPAARFPTAQDVIQHLAVLSGVEHTTAAPAWDPLAATGSVTDSETMASDASLSSASAQGVAPRAPATHDAETLAADSRDRRDPDDQDDDLTLTKM